VQGAEDLFVRLAGEQLDLPGGQAGLGVQGGQKLPGERDGGWEAGADAARPGPARYPVPTEHGGDFRVGVERGEESGLGGWSAAGAGSAAADRDAGVVQRPEHQLGGGVEVGGDLGGASIRSPRLSPVKVR